MDNAVQYVVFAPVNRHRPWLAKVYHGVVKEGEQMVTMDPPLIAIDKDAPLSYAGEICGFRISGPGAASFEVVLVDGRSGEGIVRALEPVGCGPSAHRELSFILHAYDCGDGLGGANQRKSHKATVHVRVKSVNRHTPVFGRTSYNGSVTEEHVGEPLVHVEATDTDCTPQYGNVCDYQLMTPDVPFTVDASGVIRATDKLGFAEPREYQLSVTAFDCGKRRAAEDATVTIQVEPTCRPGWQGWSQQVDYEPGSGLQPLFPAIFLETCGQALASVRAALELQSNHIGRGCDRETYAESSRRRLCGATEGGIELLPSPAMLESWTQDIRVEQEAVGDSGEAVFHFEGSQAALVPDMVAPVNLSERFTLATWLRHGVGHVPRGEKEAVLCSSDKAGMNRHHYSLYIHNCRLVFLLRTELGHGDPFQPAEFHWKLEQVCDQEWHHYVITVDLPSVTLFVDGMPYQPYLVTDDWPIRPGRSHSQLTIGACWHGGDLPSPQFAQHLRGDLAGLMLLPGWAESASVIACLHACKESLDLPNTHLASAIAVQFNPSHQVISMEASGPDLAQLTGAMQRIGYINSRQFPTPGPRRVKLSTTIGCAAEACVAVPDVEAFVQVLRAEDPRISLGGTDHMAHSAEEISNGVVLFPDLHVVSSVTKELGAEGERHGQEAMVSEEILHTLDRCEVAIIDNTLEPRQEWLEVPHEQLGARGLEATNSSQGLVITGVDSLASYEQVLHSLRYMHNNPEGLFERQFRLSCSELNGRYMSNPFQLDLTVLHTLHSMQHVNHLQAAPEFVQSDRYTELGGHSVAATQHSTAIPSMAAVVIVLCVGFLVFAIVLGVVRARSANKRGARDHETSKEGEMDWDDSALTITVNPMESYECPGSEGDSEAEVVAEDGDEEEEDDEEEPAIGESESSDGEAEDEVKGVKAEWPSHPPRQQLEWDDSTLTF
uniref:calsyntenin-1-like n=1 Tax=Myxine glutinosa TaxID=7769 RepID=UPI00358F4E50